MPLSYHRQIRQNFLKYQKNTSELLKLMHLYQRKIEIQFGKFLIKTKNIMEVFIRFISKTVSIFKECMSE